MRSSVREFVRERSHCRCEYCHLHESGNPLLGFHIEHIIAKKHHGSDRPENLAWSCANCNFGKAANLSGWDLETRRVVPLFNPRRQRWSIHFEWDGILLVGISPCGRVTVDVLNINEPHMLEVRGLLQESGDFPQA